MKYLPSYQEGPTVLDKAVPGEVGPCHSSLLSHRPQDMNPFQNAELQRAVVIFNFHPSSGSMEIIPSLGYYLKLCFKEAAGPSHLQSSFEN